MDKLLIKCGSIIMDRLGYEIKDETGKNNFKVNMVDFVLFISYFCLSMWNVIAAWMNGTYSVSTYILNIIFIWRLCVKNYIEEKVLCQKVVGKEVEKKICMSEVLTKVHKVKIVIYAVVGTFALLVLIGLWFDIVKIGFLAGLSGVAILCTLVENLLEMAERLFDAQPKIAILRGN